MVLLRYLHHGNCHACMVSGPHLIFEDYDDPVVNEDAREATARSGLRITPKVGRTDDGKPVLTFNYVFVGFLIKRTETST